MQTYSNIHAIYNHFIQPFCKVCLNLMFTSDFTSIFEGHLQKWLKHMMTAFLISPPYPTKQININLCYREKKEYNLMKQNFRLLLKMIFYSKKNQ